MNFITVLTLVSMLSVSAIAYLHLKTKKDNLLAKLTALSLGVIILGYSGSAIALPTNNLTFGALGAKDSAVSKQYEEVLKSTPSGNHYTGLEYTEEMGADEQAVDDASLTKAVEALSGDDVVVAVSNGSVRLSGTVDTKANAKDIIAKTKGLAGVREITFDLGYDK